MEPEEISAGVNIGVHPLAGSLMIPPVGVYVDTGDGQHIYSLNPGCPPEDHMGFEGQHHYLSHQPVHHHHANISEDYQEASTSSALIDSGNSGAQNYDEVFPALPESNLGAVDDSDNGKYYYSSKKKLKKS